MLGPRFNTEAAAQYVPAWRRELTINTFRNREAALSQPREPMRCVGCQQSMPRGDVGLFCPTCR